MKAKGGGGGGFSRGEFDGWKFSGGGEDFPGGNFPRTDVNISSQNLCRYLNSDLR